MHVCVCVCVYTYKKEVGSGNGQNVMWQWFMSIQTHILGSIVSLLLLLFTRHLPLELNDYVKGRPNWRNLHLQSRYHHYGPLI